MPILIALLLGFIVGLLTRHLPPSMQGASYWIQTPVVASEGAGKRVSWKTGLACPTVVVAVDGKRSTVVKGLSGNAPEVTDHDVQIAGAGSDGKRFFVLFPDGTTEELPLTPAGP